MANLETRIRERGSIKGRVTAFSHFIDDLDAPPSSLQLSELKERMEATSPSLNLYYLKHEDVLGLLNEPDDELVQSHEDKRIEFEELYFETIARARHLLNHAAETRADGAPPPPIVQQPVHVAPPHQHIQLPKISLPTFSGEHDAWMEFRDKYASLIHTSVAIADDVQRFHYLRSCLTGEAALIIQNVEFTAANYLTAWNMLCNRFDNPCVLMHSHIKAIFGMDRIPKESATRLREMLDSLTKHLGALRRLENAGVDLYSALIIYIATSKFDTTTAREWEEKFSYATAPTVDNLMQFIRDKSDLLFTLDMKRTVSTAERENAQSMTNKLNASNNVTARKHHHYPRTSSSSSHSYVSNRPAGALKCYVCKQAHIVRNCDTFLAMTPNERFNKIKELNRCINCFSSEHRADFCKSNTCSKCQRKHNTLLHFGSYADNSSSYHASSTTLTAQHCYSLSRGLLSTALIYIFDAHDRPLVARVLLDSGSQSQFITEDLASRLKLPLESFKMPIVGIASSTSMSKFCCSARLSSIHHAFEFETKFHVLSRITGNVPSVNFDVASWGIPNTITLADPSFYKPAPIDALIGAEHFLSLLTNGQIQLAKRGPVLQNTKLGWIMSGTAAGTNASYSQSLLTSRPSLSDLLSRFWEIEESGLGGKQVVDDECEKHFREHTTRGEDGRIIVCIPTKNLEKLGDTRDIAQRRFLQLEQRLERNPDLKSQYHKFMREYLEMGHMTPSACQADAFCVFLPHHAVRNELSTSTKLRVVFNGSAKSATGVTWNDCQLVGPRIQQELFSILVRFRKHRYVVSADISKMFRMVEVHHSQWPLQQIFWRFNANEPITAYSLKTVTYGTAAASYLAIRALIEVANDIDSHDPATAECIRENFYVDDYLSGANSIAEARDQAIAVYDALLTARFDLRKWRSNSHDVIANFTESSTCSLDFASDMTCKTLGLQWKPESDTLVYRICLPTPRVITKRVILSVISKVYDPLGLVAPCTVTGKILMQRLWVEKVDWDQSLSAQLSNEWTTYNTRLSILNTLVIPRHAINSLSSTIELHGFADASTKAYGGCIYIRSLNSDASFTVSLLCSKSKVSPLKTLSIPRLELCAALLVTRLMHRTIDALKMSKDSVVSFLWSDSSVVLAWLKHCPSTLERFVANRVSEIQTLSANFQWRHVSSGDNPADLVSRGVSPQELGSCKLWWEGPSWLSQDRDAWPIIDCQTSTNCPTVALVTAAPPVLQSDFGSCLAISKFSSWSHLLRTTAYVLKYLSNLRVENSFKSTFLTVEELKNARVLLLRIAQNEAFANELVCLRQGLPLRASSSILSLSPILDADGLLRVGGRLSKSSLLYDQNHTILLPRSHAITNLIFRHEHLRLYHVGPLGLLNAVHQAYWPIAGKSLARKIVHNCVTCVRAHPRPTIPIMGDLPRERVVPSHPFQKSGVDYAGPFKLKTIHSRGCKTYKAFVAVFVCMATKAVHLELVTELSSAAFLTALRRFVGRRGHPSVMFSDNGTNFVGANRELKDLIKVLKRDDVAEAIAQIGIEWRFIPARSPHFGGLWESGVRALKYHLRRVLGLQTLTYEDFSTLLVQVEAILNSRPLTPLSDDPSDLSCLTPAHFLIGRPLTSLPMNEYSFDCTTLSRFEHIQRMTQHLWRRWQQEYLRTLQRRTKWRRSSPHPPLCKNDLVVLMEENVSPLLWRLARVIDLHPGSDNVIRVASVRTSTGIVKRSVHRLCLLPTTVEEPPSIADATRNATSID